MFRKKHPQNSLLYVCDHNDRKIVHNTRYVRLLFSSLPFQALKKKNNIWKTKTARPVLLRFGLLTNKRRKNRTNKHEILAFFCYHWTNKIKLLKQTPVWLALHQLLSLKNEHQLRRNIEPARLASPRLRNANEIKSFEVSLAYWRNTRIASLATLLATKQIKYKLLALLIPQNFSLPLATTYK